MKVQTVYCYLGLWSVKIRTMSAGIKVTSDLITSDEGVLTTNEKNQIL